MSGIPVDVDLFEEIARLKREKNALLLAHYYQDDDIQDVADFIGDSLELSRRAVATQARLIVFAGVYFMAETAKILNPTRTVVIPDANAGCSLVEQSPEPEFRAWREAHPDHFVITYINSSAAIKAMSDVICTSSNAVDIVNRAPKDRPILFAPDRNLGRWVRQQSGRSDIELWNGACIVHEVFSLQKILALQAQHPDAELIAHPECEEPVLQRADFIGSTSKLLRYVQESPKPAFIVATESGILHQMKKAAPDKLLIPAPPDENCPCNHCPHMKLHTLEKLYLALRDEQPVVELAEDLRLRALAPIEKMLAWS
jgi:quinolinate synthase